MAYDRSYHDESDGDDYDARRNTGLTSPTLHGQYSPTQSEATEHTPTGYGRPKSYYSEGTIMRWSADDCAEFVSSMGLEQYADSFIDEEIDGEALIALQHADLRDMGIASLGHRLTILKGVYDEKISSNVPIEPDHYVPLSADANAPDAHATQDDVARIINQIKLRDERIMTAEAELRALREDMWRLQEEQRKFREDTLPVIRMVKEQKAPLPTPDALEERGNPLSPIEPSAPAGKSGLARKFSKKGLHLPGTAKIPSPTMKDNGELNPSAAAMAASNHLTASMSSGGASSPKQASPTSPPVTAQYSASQQRPYWQQQQSQQPSPGTNGIDATAQSGGRQASNISSRRAVPTINTSNPPSASSSAPPNSTVSTVPPSSAISGPSQGPPQGGSGPGEDPSGFMKSFRVGMEEPCYKVLPQALKKYNIADDWRQYSLYIVHGDQERCLGLDERPLILFKQLANEGKKPMFMLRKHAAPLHGHESQAARASLTPSVSLPGGVL